MYKCGVGFALLLRDSWEILSDCSPCILILISLAAELKGFSVHLSLDSGLSGLRVNAAISHCSLEFSLPYNRLADVTA